jgi:hypothetical protein
LASHRLAEFGSDLEDARRDMHPTGFGQEFNIYRCHVIYGLGMNRCHEKLAATGPDERSL